MAPKRKSDAMSTHQTTLTMGVPPIAVLAPAKEDPNTPNEDAEPASKKARVGTASSSKAQPAPKIKEKKGEKKVLHWTEVTLEGEEEVRLFSPFFCAFYLRRGRETSPSSTPISRRVGDAY